MDWPNDGRARIITRVAACAVGAALVCIHGAPEAVAAVPREGAPQTRAEAERLVGAGAVKYYTKTYGVDAAEARARLAVQEMAGDLDGTLSDRFGADFVQAWYDNTGGEWVIEGSSSLPARALRSEMSDRDIQDAYRLERVAFTRTEFDQARRDLLSDAVENLDRQATVLVVEDATLEVRVSTTAPTSELESLRSEATDSGVPVTVKRVSDAERNVRPNLWCAPPLCDALIGGVQWWNSAASCTLAFATASTGTPNVLYLTAGHCTFAAANWHSVSTCNPGYSGCAVWGHQIPYGYYGNGGGDVGLLENTVRPTYPGVVQWSTSTHPPLYNAFRPGVSTVACTDGATTGHTCGTVSSSSAWGISYAAWGPFGPQILNDMVEVTGGCTTSGDSGAPVTSSTGGTAFGIHSGGNSGCYTSAARQYVEPIDRALAQLGVSLYWY